MDARQDKPPTTEIIVGILLPLVGVVLAVVLLAKGRGAHGAAVLVASVLAFLVWAAVLGA